MEGETHMFDSVDSDDETLDGTINENNFEYENKLVKFDSKQLDKTCHLLYFVWQSRPPTDPSPNRSVLVIMYYRCQKPRSESHLATSMP